MFKNLIRSILHLFEPFGRLLDASDGTKTLLRIRRQLQPNGYSCGQYAALTILLYFGLVVHPAHLAAQLNTTKEGTDDGDIVKVFAMYGLRPRVKDDASFRDLQRSIRRGSPVLVTVRDGAHYSVVIGYSKTHVYLADPSIFESFRRAVSKTEFLKRWDRWGVFVQAPR